MTTAGKVWMLTPAPCKSGSYPSWHMLACLEPCEEVLGDSSCGFLKVCVCPEPPLGCLVTYQADRVSMSSGTTDTAPLLQAAWR